jgi:transcriptional regulator with XRE-family HTH domain
MDTLGRRIWALRALRGVSQSELARRSGLKQPTLQRIEKSKSANPSVKAVSSVARALGVATDALLPTRMPLAVFEQLLGDSSKLEGVSMLSADNLDEAIESPEAVLAELRVIEQTASRALQLAQQTEVRVTALEAAQPPPRGKALL